MSALPRSLLSREMDASVRQLLEETLRLVDVETRLEQGVYGEMAEITVDPSLAFLDNFVSQSLQDGASPYRARTRGHGETHGVSFEHFEVETPFVTSPSSGDRASADTDETTETPTRWSETRRHTETHVPRPAAQSGVWNSAGYTPPPPPPPLPPPPPPPPTAHHHHHRSMPEVEAGPGSAPAVDVMETSLFRGVQCQAQVLPPALHLSTQETSHARVSSVENRRPLTSGTLLNVAGSVRSEVIKCQTH
ncbi:uncharacterized protein LOC116937776 [Petromyzon marinus]|uniref:uncharacterized protein LOC116937776 n=1 Tax=Petromyzon marinus TaxID=7757 RepID=UPI003F73036C